jgi:hypothetical protein
MDTITIDTIIMVVPCIMTGHAVMSVQVMLIPTITGRNTGVKDTAVRRVSTMLRKANEPVLQGNISSKPAILHNPPTPRIETGRKLSGYGKIIIQQLQKKHSRIIAGKIPAL